MKESILFMDYGRNPFLPSSFLLKQEIFYNEGGEALERAAQRGSGGPMPGNIQGQVGRGSEEPDLVKDVPAHCGRVGLNDL